MAMNRRRKICIALAVILLVFFIVLPLVLGAALRGTVEKKIGEATKAPVKLGSLSVKLFPPGAVFGDLEIGEPVAEAGGAPLAKIGTIKARVSWGTVWGGAVHVTSLKLADAEVALCCGEQGRSNLRLLLEKMGPSDRAVPLPIDELVIRDSRLTFCVPAKLVAPQSPVAPEAVTAEVGYLCVEHLVLPPPGQSAELGAWVSLALERLRIAAPLRGVTSPASPAEAGVPLEEGVAVGACRAEVALFAADGVTRLRGGRLDGLRVRNLLHAPKVPETIQRIHRAMALCLAMGLEAEGGPGGGCCIEELRTMDGIVEIAGPDARGQPAFYRLSRLEVDARHLPWGPGAATPAGVRGSLRVASPSVSSAGPGSVSAEWQGIEGAWPKLTFEARKEVRGFALAPMSARIEQQTGAGVEGSVEAVLAGATREGRIEWDGTMTLSKDTRLVGKSLQGKMLSGLGSLTADLSGLASGKPMEGLGVRGTLDDPKMKWPAAFSKTMADLAGKLLTGDAVSLPGVLLKVPGDAAGRGLEQGKDLMKKVPGVGDLFK